MNSIRFSPEPENIRHAIAASFDMSGFSPFCRRPNAHAYLTRYLAHLFEAFDTAFQDSWRDCFKDTSHLIQVPRPDFAKYTGDGALLLWVRDGGEEFSNEFCTSVVAALRHFQQQLPEKIAGWERQWRTDNLPKIARFGIAIGPVQPLSAPYVTILDHEIIDYAGYCINLAVRLQDHCPAVGFIVHAPVAPELEGLISLQALKMKGSLDEPVYVFKDDFDRACSAAPKLVHTKFTTKG
jgi:class 3 adenylate cyclase